MAALEPVQLGERGRYSSVVIDRYLSCKTVGKSPNCEKNLEKIPDFRLWHDMLSEDKVLRQ